MEGTKLLMASSCAAVAPRPGQRAPAYLTASGFHGSSCTFFKDGRDYLSTRKLRVRRREGKGLMVQALFGLGVPELVVIAGVTALIFGPKKLPEIGKSIGKTVKSFQQAAKEFETEVKRESEPPTTDLPKSESSEVAPEADEKNIKM